MAVIKVPLKHGEKIKKYLVSKKLMDFGRTSEKDLQNIYFPVIGKFDFEEKFPFINVVKKTLKKKEQKVTKLREALKGILTEQEFEKLNTAFDIVGTIAIMDIDKSLVKKEKKIANKLLEINNNIKTVVKKASIHSGEFRTQKMKHLAGEKTLEASYRELNVRLNLDVEKVYFSSRTSTERKRIASLVKKGENILVMFSGCAPLPCVLSKNTDAEFIYGIEINPVAHKYGIENVNLNKLHNVVLLNGDVREIVPNFYESIIGLKSADNTLEMESRMIKHPHIMEIHIQLRDLFEKRKKLEQTIMNLQKEKLQVIIHMPFRNFKGEYLNLGNSDENNVEILNSLGELCIKHGVKAIVHPVMGPEIKKDENTLIENLLKLRKYYDHFYFENGAGKGTSFSDLNDIKRIAKKAGIKNICVDICHAYMHYKNNAKIIEHIETLKKDYNLYFHLADSNGETHGAEIGTGKVDYNKILPLVTWGVAEVTSKDEFHPLEELRSYQKMVHMHKTFDRILMPLPKSAEDFLDMAFLASKKNTIIHFYDFLHDDDFPNKSIDKIMKASIKAGKKVKVLDSVRCGQYSPRTFRVCIDFKVL